MQGRRSLHNPLFEELPVERKMVYRRKGTVSVSHEGSPRNNDDIQDNPRPSG